VLFCQNDTREKLFEALSDKKLACKMLMNLTPGIVPFFPYFPSIYIKVPAYVKSTPQSLIRVRLSVFAFETKKMESEGQDHFLDSRGDKKQPSVTRPVQVNLKTFLLCFTILFLSLSVFYMKIISLIIK